MESRERWSNGLFIIGLTWGHFSDGAGAVKCWCC